MKKIISIVAVLACLCACKSADSLVDGMIPSDDGLFPFVISYDTKDNATNISSIVEAPAGKDGFIRIEDGHFVNDKGRVRLNATNLTASANFPEHEQAERMAARMARFGINCVRLHYMDYPYGPDFFPLAKEPCIFANDCSNRNLDPEMIDRLDYMIYQFKQHGIYVDVNLYVAREAYGMKDRSAVNKEAQAKEREYARDLLTHVNPYTGLAMVNDPVVAVVELNNEDALYATYLWGHAKLPHWPALKELKESKDAEAKLKLMDEIDSYESSHWNNMLAFLRNDLGLKVPVTSTQVTYSMPQNFDGMDFFDSHAYWQHPRVQVYWEDNNISMVNAPDGGCIASLAARRYAGKPFTVSEYNHPYPSFYGAEGQPMLRAYGAFHGWDGVFSYSWNNRMNEEPQSMEYFFSYCARTDALAHFIACAAMYLRGDVREGETEINPTAPRKAFRDDWVEEPTVAGRIDKIIGEYSSGTVTRESYLLHKSATDLDAIEARSYPVEEIGAVKVSDTGELEWNNEDSNHGMFFVRTPNVKLFTGFPEGRILDMGDGVVMNVGKTKLGWTTMSLTSMNADGFGAGSRVLLAATGYTHNTDQKFTVKKDEDGNPTTWISSRLEDWGKAPIVTEGIPATITLPSDASATSCWALDEAGERKAEVPVKASSEGKAVIGIGPEYKTVWYEITVK